MSSRSALVRALALTLALVALPVPPAFAEGAAPVTSSIPAPPPTPIEAAIAEAWDFEDAAESEKRFRTLLTDARSKDPLFRLEVETQLARSLGLQQKFDDAHKVLDGVDKALRAGENPRVRVRYLLERGRCFNSSKRAAEGLPLFKQAWDLARQAKEDNLAVDAAHMLAIAEPDRKVQEKWAYEAIAYAEASPDLKVKGWLGSLYNNLGWTLHDAGRAADALGLFEKCLAWHRERKTGMGEVIARWTVARCKRTLGRTEEALAAQQALAADLALQKLPEDGFVFEEIGECLYALGRKGEAKPFFGKAYVMLSKDIWLQRDEPARIQRLADLAK